MSTVAGRDDGRPVPPPVHREARPDGVAPVEPDDRGSLTIAPAVYCKLIRRVAHEFPEVLSDRRGGRGVRVRRHDGAAGPRRRRRWVRGRRRHGSAPDRFAGPADGVRVRLAVALRYPCGVREVAGRIRDRVIAEVDRVTGTPVRALDIVVDGLRADAGPSPR
ncbi:hypothetical protein FHR81_005612 [Actinoalloteichus hoggarensis]|uniref:Uncharacterized protein n=1 Tax=Actinoalloteichus hoggarensis TaxID=1470176 RepID=A0A221W888_9PSEU|nr:Asp23/Gls24 family envelope stress response protein [Actinoalloteichus hoggarensis]ASO21923.1 hypothetical protein AHOG_21535 [Actinoalloteichus hoggarensis]MBB5924527.1 hypothetical protein [Actinoalloteichus hoggarensis]